MAKSKRAERLEALAEQIRVCTKCPLWESSTLAVPGDGPYRAKAMIIGEAPGREEDESGHPLSARPDAFSITCLKARA